MNDEYDAYPLTVFCKKHGFSRSTYYLLPQEDRPQEMRIGKRVLITKEAAARWRERMERKSSGEVA